MNTYTLIILWTMLSFIGWAFMFNAHNMWKLVDNKTRTVEAQNINMLSKLKRDNMDTISMLNKTIIDNIKIWDTVLQANKKDILYGGKVKPEVWYKFKKALYISKTVWFDSNELKTTDKPIIFTLTNVHDDLNCKPWYLVDTTSLSDIIKKLKVAKINPKTFKDINWNVKTISEIKKLLNLTNQQAEILWTIRSPKCNLANWKIGKSYIFVPKSKLPSILKSKELINKYSSYIIDVVDQNTLHSLWVAIPLYSLPKPISIRTGIGGNELDITSKNDLDQICDAWFYFDQSEDRCKPDIERHLDFYSFFSVVNWNHITYNTNKIWWWLMLNDTKEYYVTKPSKSDWIENWLYAYNWNITTNDNIVYDTWYTISVWFTPKTDNSTILKTNNNKFKIYNDDGKLKVLIQWKTIDVGNLYKNNLYNILISYDKITNRIWIYLNWNPNIKAEKNNAGTANWFDVDIDLWNKFILWSWNEYFMFKVWSEWFGNYLLNVIYNLENNLWINYAGMPNPWFKNTYNWATTCTNTQWLTTIQWTQGIGIVNCKLNNKVPGKISMYDTFNKWIRAWKLQTDIWTNLLSLKDNNGIENINDINHIFTEYKSNNIWLNASKAVNLNLWFNISDNSVNNGNWYTLAFILNWANNWVIADGVFKIERDNTTLKIANQDFTYSSHSDNVIVITTNTPKNEATICVNNSNWTNCKTIPKLWNWNIRFTNWIIDNLLYKPYAIDKETVKVISENLGNDNPNLEYITSCNNTTTDWIYTIKIWNKLFNAVCYGDNGDKNILVYNSIFSKFDKNSTKLDSKWNTIRWNWNIQYYSDIVDVCRQYNLKPFIVKWNNTDWYNKLEDILHDYTNYYNWDNWWGLAIWLWYDQAKEGWFNLDNLASNGMWAGTFRFKIGDNLPDNDNWDAMNSDYRFASFWAGSDNKNWPEDWKGGETLWVVCGGKEIEWLTPPISIADFDTATNDLDNRKEYIYTFDWTTWHKWDFYACPVGKVYDTQKDVCKKATDGNLVKVFDLSDAYKAWENLNPENNSEFNDLDHKYYTGDYLEGAYTWYDYDKIWSDYSKLSNNNPYDAGDGDTLYWVKTEGELCVWQEDDYQFAVDGWGTIEMDIKVGSNWYGTKKYWDKKAQKDKIDILTLHLKKGCYPIVMRYSSSSKWEDNYVVWFNNGAGWDILKGNYLKMYKNEDYLNKDTEPTITVTQ